MRVFFSESLFWQLSLKAKETLKCDFIFHQSKAYAEHLFPWLCETFKNSFAQSCKGINVLRELCFDERWNHISVLLAMNYHSLFFPFPYFRIYLKSVLSLVFFSEVMHGSLDKEIYTREWVAVRPLLPVQRVTLCFCSMYWLCSGRSVDIQWTKLYANIILSVKEIIVTR